MKIKRILFLLITVLLILTSCNLGINKIDESEGSVNYYIYPYLKFKLSSDLTYYEVSVVEGAKLTSVSIPGYVHTDYGKMPVKVFKGFDNPKDAENLKIVYIDVNVAEISSDAFDYANSLEKVITTSVDKNQNWSKLPPYMKRNGYHFHGWKVGDIIYDGGSTIPVSPDSPEALPYFIELEYHAAVSATCTKDGNIEYWNCPECGKLFTDSNAVNSVNSVSVPATGHLFPLVHFDASEPTCQTEGNKEYWRCDRCMETFADSEGTIPLPDYRLDKVDHQSDGNTYYSETVHYQKCKWCGTVINEGEHTFSKWVIDIPATEHTKGLKHADCSYCNYTKIVEIPEHDHFDYEPAEKVKHEATCLEGAYYIEKCGNPECGEVLKVLIEEEPATGHQGKLVEYKDSTCTEKGIKAHIWCTVCDKPFENQWSSEPMVTIEIELKPHDYSTKWTIGEDTHYHLCNSCGIARSDESKHIYQQIVDQKYLKYSSTCQHANQYVESCECGKEGSELFESGTVGNHSFTVYEAIDEEYHRLVCEWCGSAKPYFFESHNFISDGSGKKCDKCGYKVSSASGGFDVIVVDKAPKGHLEEVSHSGSIWTFQYVNDKDDYPPTMLEWYVNEKLIRRDKVEGLVSYPPISFEALYPITYKVYCRFLNSYGTGSETVVVKGGSQ